MTARERAESVFTEWEKKGVMPFDETHWMNRDDREAIIAPIAKAIEDAVEEALYARDQDGWSKDK